MNTTTNTPLTDIQEKLHGWATQADNRHQAALAHLTEQVTDGSLDAMAVAVNRVAVAEGEWHTFSRIHILVTKLVNLDTAPEHGRVVILSNLLDMTDPDDRWSGRTNDARRSRADGVRSAADRIVDGLS